MRLWVLWEKINKLGNILEDPIQHLFKFNNRNTRNRCGICSKLTKKTPEWRQWRRSGVFIVNFEHISNFFLVFLLLTLNRLMFPAWVSVMVSCRPIKEIIEAFCLCLKRKKCAEYLRSLRDKCEITPVDKVLNDFKKHVSAIWRADSDYILGACYIGYIITNVFLHGVFLFLDKIVSKIQILLFHMNNKHCVKYARILTFSDSYFHI